MHHLIRRCALWLAMLFMAVQPVAAQGIDPAARGLAVQAKTKANLQTAINLFDPRDTDVALGYYPLYTSGALLNNVAFNTTGYIPVQAGQTYTRTYMPFNTSTTYPGVSTGQVAFYDQNKVFVSGLNPSGATFTAPNGPIYFMRIGVPVANWWDFQLYAGGSVNYTWTPYTQKETRDWSPSFQISTLRQTHYRAGNLLFGQSITGLSNQQLIINLVGDSYQQIANRVTTPMTMYLVSRLGDAGGGWVGFGFLASSAGTPPWTAGNQPSNLNGNARPALYAARLYGNPTGTYYTAATADLASATLLASGDAAEVDLPTTASSANPVISAIKLHYVASASGSIRYGFGATQGATPASWTTLSLSGTAGTTTVATLSLTNMAQPGTLRIEWVSGTAQISGVDLQSNAPGVRINKLAATGSSWSNWISVDPTNWQTSFAALGAHLTINNDGRNSQASAYAAATRDNSAKELFARERGKTTASTGNTMAMDILIYTSAENSAPGSTIAISSYAQSDRRRAYLCRCAHIDGQAAFGYATFPSEYAYNGDVPLMANDNSGNGSIHPAQNTGGTLMAWDLIKAILP